MITAGFEFSVDVCGPFLVDLLLCHDSLHKGQAAVKGKRLEGNFGTFTLVFQ